MLITTATSRDEQDREARVPVLPVLSFEQHGDLLPLIESLYCLKESTCRGQANAKEALLLPA
jgi:creatinine amidohydrolase/Fe(II)-dependent formamide hydrolase-like protein